MGDFLPGCGVAVVSWLPVPTVDGRTKLRDAGTDLTSTTLRKALRRISGVVVEDKSNQNIFLRFREARIDVEKLIAAGETKVACIKGLGEACMNRIREILTPDEWRRFTRHT